MRKRAPFLGAAAIAVVLAGCTTTNVAPEPTGTPKASLADMLTTAGAEPAWEVEGHFIGEAPVQVGGTIIAYASTSKSEVSLVGFDAETGERSWSWPSSVQDGWYERLEVRVVGDGDGGALVASTSRPFVGDGDEWRTAFSLLDPETGEPVAETREYWVSSFTDCDIPVGACFWGNRASGEELEKYSLAPDGTVAAYSAPDDWLEYKRVASDVYVANDGAGNGFVLRVQDGEELWRTPAQELTGAGSDIYNGLSSWTVMDRADVVAFYADEGDQPEVFRVPAADGVGGALDYETGEVLWTKDGVLACTVDGEVILFCSGDIGVEREKGYPAAAIYAGAIDIEGVDALTGDSRWTAELDDASGLTNTIAQGDTAQNFGGAFTVRGKNGVKFVDIATGEIALLEDGQMYPCTTSVSVTDSKWSIPGEGDVTLDSGTVLQGCTTDGTEADSSAFTEAVVDGATGWVWTRPGDTAPEDGPEIVQTATELRYYRH